MVIKDSSLDDPHPVNTSKRIAIPVSVNKGYSCKLNRSSSPEERCPAVTAEIRGNFFSSVGDFADLLRSSLKELELLRRNDDVVGVVTSGDLFAVGAVAERL